MVVFFYYICYNILLIYKGIYMKKGNFFSLLVITVLTLIIWAISAYLFLKTESEVSAEVFAGTGVIAFGFIYAVLFKVRKKIMSDNGGKR